MHALPPSPSPSSSQYLIRVHATALTANELTWRETITRPLPIPGHDVSGTIVSVPAEGPANFNANDEVFALTSFSRDGAAAEYVLAEEHELARKPGAISHEEAVAVPLSALTAWQALFTHAALEAGQLVLVLGAAGGVGTMAVQLARWNGARVVGTCSEGKVGFVKSLGAHEVIDYQKSRVDGKFEVVLDCVGGETQEGGWEHVKEGGILMSVAEPLKDESKKQFPGIRSLFFVVEPNGTQLERIAKAIDEGKVKPVVDRVFPLEKGEAAFELLAHGRTRGKIVLHVHA
ncbi:hypothetical protein MMC22_003376 [Lobaria immixta]|nr:hypothetical protein [Lobaria immixta]